MEYPPQDWYQRMEEGMAEIREGILGTPDGSIVGMRGEVRDITQRLTVLEAKRHNVFQASWQVVSVAIGAAVGALANHHWGH